MSVGAQRSHLLNELSVDIRGAGNVGLKAFIGSNASAGVTSNDIVSKTYIAK